MKKLIELDATLDALREVIVPAEDIGFGDELTDGYNDGIDMAITVISGLTTVDAVEVVRCRDCKNSEHWYADRRRCFLWHENGVSVFDGGFCNYGERKDGEQHG